MITLTPEQEKLVDQAVETGAYASSGDVLNQALELLRAQDEWLAENRVSIDARIQDAIAQLDRGEGISSDELEQRLAKRKEDWLTRQQH